MVTNNTNNLIRNIRNMNRKKSGTIRLDDETRKILKNLSFDLSAIERNKVTTPEILKRMTSSQEIIEKLKIGSLDRRKKRLDH